MRTSRSLGLVVIVLLLTLTPAAAAAAPSHIRSTSPELRALIDAGIDRSPTFHDLVQQLEASDVVVYVSFGSFSNPGIAGKIQFIAAAGGSRYLQIVVAHLPDPSGLAILGHELRHAAEIAATPSVVDNDSLARCYARIGFRVLPETDRFDTSSAVEYGRRVLMEAFRTCADGRRASPGRRTPRPIP